MRLGDHRAFIGSPCTVPVVTLITDTVPSPAFVAYALLPSLLNVTELGFIPTLIGSPRTVPVLTLITDTVSSSAFVT